MKAEDYMKIRIIGSDITHYSTPNPIVTDEQLKQWGLAFIAGAIFGSLILLLIQLIK